MDGQSVSNFSANFNFGVKIESYLKHKQWQQNAILIVLLWIVFKNEFKGFNRNLRFCHYSVTHPYVMYVYICLCVPQKYEDELIMTEFFILNAHENIA